MARTAIDNRAPVTRRPRQQAKLDAVPVKFKPGDRVKVIGNGACLGMTGTVVRYLDRLFFVQMDEDPKLWWKAGGTLIQIAGHNLELANEQRSQ